MGSPGNQFIAHTGERDGFLHQQVTLHSSTDIASIARIAAPVSQTAVITRHPTELESADPSGTTHPCLCLGCTKGTTGKAGRGV